jgi:hypothetical protein
MTEFIQQDLSGARFEQVLLKGATFQKVRFNGATLRDVDLRDIVVHGAVITGRMRGVEFWDLELNGEIGHLTVNGVDVGPLVEAELDRQMPDRVLMRPTDADGFRKGFATIQDKWDATVEHARTFPPEALHRSIDDEWSFVQTLRHLNFATVCWVGMVVGDGNPWHPLDLPWDEAPGWDGVPWDKEATPSLDEVLAVRAQRRTLIQGVLDSLTTEELERKVSALGPGQPEDGPFSVAQCLRVVLNEEWEHRLYAERDLAIIEKGEPA